MLGNSGLLTPGSTFRNDLETELDLGVLPNKAM